MGNDECYRNWQASKSLSFTMGRNAVFAIFLCHCYAFAARRSPADVKKVTRRTFVTDHLQTALCYRTHKFCWQMLAVNQLHADDDGRHFQLLFIYRRWLWSGVLLLLRLLPLPSSAESAGANGRWTSVMSKGETFSGGLIIENGHPGSLNGRMVIDEQTHSEVRVQRRSLKKAASV